MDTFKKENISDAFAMPSDIIIISFLKGSHWQSALAVITKYFRLRDL